MKCLDWDFSLWLIFNAKPATGNMPASPLNNSQFNVKFNFVLAKQRSILFSFSLSVHCTRKKNYMHVSEYQIKKSPNTWCWSLVFSVLKWTLSSLFILISFHVHFDSFNRLNFKFILIFRIYLNYQASISSLSLISKSMLAVGDSIRDIHRTDILKLKS